MCSRWFPPRELVPGGTRFRVSAGQVVPEGSSGPGIRPTLPPFGGGRAVPVDREPLPENVFTLGAVLDELEFTFECNCGATTKVPPNVLVPRCGLCGNRLVGATG